MSVVVAGEALVDLAPRDGLLLPLPGGSPYNVAVGLGRLGSATHYLGGLSRDAFGALMSDRLAANGVDPRPGPGRRRTPPRWPSSTSTTRGGRATASTSTAPPPPASRRRCCPSCRQAPPCTSRSAPSVSGTSRPAARWPPCSSCRTATPHQPRPEHPTERLRQAGGLDTYTSLLDEVVAEQPRSRQGERRGPRACCTPTPMTRWTSPATGLAPGRLSWSSPAARTGRSRSATAARTSRWPAAPSRWSTRSAPATPSRPGCWRGSISTATSPGRARRTSDRRRAVGGIATGRRGRSDHLHPGGVRPAPGR
jgi:hypothetical protein